MSTTRPLVDVRAELLAAGERVFAEKGYAAATIDDVIRESKTSRASFYRYFAGKEALFEELSRACFRKMRAVMRGFADLSCASVSRDAVLTIVETYHSLHLQSGGVIRAWTELTAPAGSPTRTGGAAAVRSIASELAQALDRAGQSGQSADDNQEAVVRATLMYLLIERSSFYMTSNVSRVEGDLLLPTLATLVHRAFFSA